MGGALEARYWTPPSQKTMHSDLCSPMPQRMINATASLSGGDGAKVSTIMNSAYSIASYWPVAATRARLLAAMGPLAKRRVMLSSRDPALVSQSNHVS